MELGIAVFVGSGGLSPQALGRAVEERGFESLFIAEHTHIPLTSRRSDGRPVRTYADTVDPFVALSAAAAVTTAITLGTGVCLVTQRDPITTAKSVASLDLVSGGRFRFGVGAGWNRPELANHGTDPRNRMAVLAERVHRAGQHQPPGTASPSVSAGLTAGNRLVRRVPVGCPPGARPGTRPASPRAGSPAR